VAGWSACSWETPLHGSLDASDALAAAICGGCAPGSGTPRARLHLREFLARGAVARRSAAGSRARSPRADGRGQRVARIEASVEGDPQEHADIRPPVPSPARPVSGDGLFDLAGERSCARRTPAWPPASSAHAPACPAPAPTSRSWRGRRPPPHQLRPVAEQFAREPSCSAQSRSSMRRPPRLQDAVGEMTDASPARVLDRRRTRSASNPDRSPGLSLDPRLYRGHLLVGNLEVGVDVLHVVVVLEVLGPA